MTIIARGEGGGKRLYYIRSEKLMPTTKGKNGRYTMECERRIKRGNQRAENARDRVFHLYNETR